MYIFSFPPPPPPPRKKRRIASLPLLLANFCFYCQASDTHRGYIGLNWSVNAITVFDCLAWYELHCALLYKKYFDEKLFHTIFSGFHMQIFFHCSSSTGYVLRFCENSQVWIELDSNVKFHQIYQCCEIESNWRKIGEHVCF